MKIIDWSSLGLFGPSIYWGQETNIGGMDEGGSGGTLGHHRVRWLERGILYLSFQHCFYIAKTTYPKNHTYNQFIA